MRRGLRIALSVLLVLAGLLIALFFGLLYFVADCSAACGRRGEHAPIYALVGAGLGLAVAGIRPRLAPGLLVAGLVSLGWSAWALAQGEGGWVWASLAGGLAVALLGAWLLRPRGR